MPQVMTEEYQDREPDMWMICPRCAGAGTIQCYQDGQPGLDWCPRCDGLQNIALWVLTETA
jgi:hypothetical protein